MCGAGGWVFVVVRGGGGGGGEVVSCVMSVVSTRMMG